MVDLIESRKHKAKKVAWALQIVPFIRFIGLTGSLAYDIVNENSDIDIFIITSAKRIWTCRFFVMLFLKIFRLQRIGDSKTARAGKICPNRFVSDDYLMINPQNRYHAQDYSQMVPLFDDNIYDKFLSENSWMKKYGYFPNRRLIILVRSAGILSSIRKISEYILRGRFGDWVEAKTKKYQIGILKKRYPNFNHLSSGIYANDEEIRIHPHPK